MATAIAMRGGPQGSTHIDYDDGTGLDTAALSPIEQALVVRAINQPPPMNPQLDGVMPTTAQRQAGMGVAPGGGLMPLQTAVRMRTRGGV